MAKRTKKTKIRTQKDKPKKTKKRATVRPTDRTVKPKRKKAAKAASSRTTITSVRRAGLIGVKDVTLHAVSSVAETACQTGVWMPLKSSNATVEIGDILGSVIFSGVPCDVEASEAGVISWIRMKSQVNSGYAVCMIEPRKVDNA